MSQPTDRPAPAPERRPYERPTLVEYGDLASLTLTSLSMNRNDPGNSSSTRT